MPDWEERIRMDSHPALRLEHALRYEAAAPIVLGGNVWCDLGCGTAAASAGPMQGFDGRAVLVDVDPPSIAEATSRFRAATTEGIVADLATDDGVEAVRTALVSGEGGCVTCFEVIEHLPRFAPTVRLLVDLAAGHGFTAVLSVPNDGFWDLHNPFHLSRWGEGAFAELMTILPEGHVIAFQADLTGSSIVRTEMRISVEADVSTAVVPTHFLVAFGPRAQELGSPAALTVSDLEGQRVWERQREADLAYFKALAERATD